ncbi:hypothetical protein, partial [Stutzerimonas nitrititolerans]|uniref:hypothetical protein n=1 Tax=Stutzerimonas nitrititolerans TaxID=2482751 RepID=UPI0035E41D04
MASLVPVSVQPLTPTTSASCQHSEKETQHADTAAHREPLLLVIQQRRLSVRLLLLQQGLQALVLFAQLYQLRR